MQIIETIEEMKRFAKERKAKGLSIGLVPTMGALHEGHLTLMRQAKRQCDVVVASIFVNPAQFGPNEDYDTYPRNMERDSDRAGSAGINAIFHPRVSEMYPAGYSSFVDVGGIANHLCGLSRPGHFRGVATVVTKLFHIVQPDTAFFGQKDAQQVLVIQRMVEDLNMNVAIEMVPIVREADGLAMSSRNAFLSPEERKAALILSSSLQLAERLVDSGERKIENIRRQVIAAIQEEERAEIDYVEIYRYPSLERLEMLAGKALLALAVRIGSTRLIDNIILEG